MGGVQGDDLVVTSAALRLYALDVLRRHVPRPTEGTYSACVWCGHTWLVDGPLGGCDEFVKAAEALGFTTTEDAHAAVR